MVKLKCGEWLVRAHIAQLVEHFLGKEEVTGSNPVMSSIIVFYEQLSCLVFFSEIGSTRGEL